MEKRPNISTLTVGWRQSTGICRGFHPAEGDGDGGKGDGRSARRHVSEAVGAKRGLPYFSFLTQARGEPTHRPYLTVGDRLLGKVVVEDDGVLAVVAEVLSDRGTGVGREELPGTAKKTYTHKKKTRQRKKMKRQTKGLRGQKLRKEKHVESKIELGNGGASQNVRREEGGGLPKIEMGIGGGGGGVLVRFFLSSPLDHRPRISFEKKHRSHS